MDLWIRSQNKKELIPIKNKIYIDKENDGKFIIYHDKNLPNEYWRDILGIYDTEKRALEVLDEIQSAIEHDGKSFYDKKEDALYTLFGVYEMPKE